MTEETSGELIRKAGKESADGDHRRAAESYRKALKAVPGAASIYYNLALELCVLEESTEARALLRKAADLNPGDADALAEIGRLDIADGRLGAAKSVLDEAIGRIPGHAAALNNRGVVAFLKGQYPEAADFFRSAVRENPLLEDAWFNLADTCDELGDTDGAVEARTHLGFGEDI